MKQGPTATSSKTWNWGIVGLGRMAEKFVSDLKLLPNARIHAVASRSLERASAFGRRHDAEHVYGSHEEIAHCPDLDVVYIATPHVLHHANTLHCLRNGVAMLCEKPFAD